MELEARIEQLSLSPAVAARVRHWLEDRKFRDERASVEALVEAATADPAAREELEDAFCGPLAIGTGGRRGTCGAGPNRMNSIVVRETAQGLADAMRAHGLPQTALVVYDTRRTSREYAWLAARQLAGNGLKVTLVDAPRPTPLLSSTIRSRGLGAGIVISASHNPPQDNGVKVYWDDGAQVVGAVDADLMRHIVAVVDGEATLAELAADKDASIEVIEGAALAELDGEYIARVAEVGVWAPEKSPGPIVYTPLHGVGGSAIVPVLRQRGFEVQEVAAQAPDGGEFATVASANPEDPESMAMAAQQASASGARLVLANDPDADRLGCMAAVDSKLAPIDGNRIAVLLLDHVLRHGDAKPGDFVITTMLTTPLIRRLCEAHDVEVIDDLLVGFKHHAGIMRERPEGAVLFACEESHGYCRGRAVHDKCGAMGALLLAEAWGAAEAEGTTLHGRLEAIWRAHGYHRETTASIYAHGASGRAAIAGLLQRWRDEPPTTLGDLSVVDVQDRQQGQRTGSPTRDLPGNVLQWTLDTGSGAGCRLVVRPSGTEPKVKLYALGWDGAVGAGDLRGSMEAVDALIARVVGDARAQASSIMGL